MKFKAAILFECLKPLLIEEISLNKLSRGQVLVKIDQSGICRSQLFEIDGERGEDKWLPHLLGHEAIGEVLEIHETVSKVKPGDKVVLTWIKSDGISAEPAKYNLKDLVINGGQITTFSEFSVCSENRMIPIKNLGYTEIGPSLGCAIPTGYGLSITESRFKDAKYIGVLGLGGIGMSALLGSINRSNAQTIAIDVLPKRIKEALSIGADHIINASEVNLKDKIEKLTNGLMLDLLIECSGNILCINRSLDLINNTGLVKFTSHPKHGDLLNINPFELIKGKKIEGSWGGGISPDQHMSILMKDISKNMKFINLLNEKTYKLEDINLAIKGMREGNILRPIIDFSNK